MLYIMYVCDIWLTPLKLEMEVQFSKIRQLEEKIFLLNEEKKIEEIAKNKALQEVQVCK